MDRAQASRRRLLEAAATEFAEHGLAGARVDRISAAAQVSKAQLYSYHGSKQELFDEVLRQLVDDIVDSVPLTADGVADYAAGLYDAYVRSPRLLRLAAWARLERSPTGPLFLPASSASKVAVIAEGQRSGVLDASLPAADAYDILVGLAMTWAPISVTYTASGDDPVADHERRRASLATAVQRLFAPR
ncbi:TetR family transcriptional regulator [Streptomyces scopuliridis]|uniref:TetR/AcrR family transcriptional regulator n=1 Tax=Streptomyces scopuliridis TaxID=452529 RepID=UPI0036B283AA